MKSMRQTLIDTAEYSALIIRITIPSVPETSIRGNTSAAPPNKIYHTVNGGISWEIEWVAPESYQAIRHISYHAVTKSLWAGGSNGRVLMRPMTVSPRGKLATLWGELKAGQNTNR